ncbi:hypothetical protein A2996_02165 [Candidatus Campbellbacteria bacterium RIFCSPLOWO2_01_FULL_34_15]|uniref:Glycosyl transferase family 1 n=2 Tax=Candidatus Campbelliibacteriota TaxID=1752727 RepID=A0A1F5ELX1_9BACT|nr:MAG: hypothetical protein A2996_02165 [Candidatus Campbellbacteria bacterium RIFCSPLOWO2_01_FULL_34_15]OGD69576.1 MAG: hypothetical protein A2811_01605 [Candidatus Campbellbacteria bacterium RIFCSPHIGHO2_01_FULL_34_10]
MNNIKVGYVTSSLAHENGWGRYSESLIRSVNKKSSVIVLTPKSFEYKEDNMKVHNVLPEVSFRPLTQIKVFLFCLKYFRQVDIIHSLVEPYAPGVALAAFFLRVPFVVTMHGTYSIPPTNFSFKKILMNYMYKRVTIATTGSPFTEKKVREIVSFGECRFIPNGVDDAIFYRNLEAKDDNYLLTVGELKKRKGADLVITALPLVKKKYPKMKYKIVGNLDNNSFVNHLKKMVKDLKLEESVEFLGRVNDNELRNLYNNCSAFVLAARDVEGSFEGFPMVFYEANACGAPVITTKGFGSEYAIKNGVNGYVVEPNNAEILASAIVKSVDSADLMRKNALKEASDHTWDKVGLQLVKLYEDAINIF